MPFQKILFIAFFFLFGGGVLFLLSEGGDDAPSPSPEDFSANISVGKRKFDAPFVPGEAIIVVQDPEDSPQIPGSMNVNSVEYNSQEADIKTSVQSLLEDKFGSDLEIETQVLFDKRGVQLSEERRERLWKIRNKERLSPNNEGGSVGRLIFAKVKSDKKTTEELLAVIEGDPDIVSSQPNYIYSLPRPNSEEEIKTPVENSENPEVLWNIFNNENGAGVGADVAWNKGLTGEGTIVAVIDTGVDIDHPDLKDNIWKNPRETNCEDGIDNDANGFVDDCHGWDFGDNDNNPKGLNFHGTHVAGTIAAVRNNTGVVGVAPGAKIMPLKVFPDNGFAQTIDVVNAIEYAWRNNVDVISTSLGREDACSSIEMQAIRQAMKAGVVVFTSSGNGDPAYDLVVPFSNAPAICDDSFATGATDRENNIPSYSNYFNEMVTAVGPGGTESDPILSTSLNGTYSGSSGTSMATPHASAIAALLFQKNHLYTPSEIIDLMCRGSDDIDEEGKDMKSGCGFLNIQSILAASDSRAPVISDLSWSPDPIQQSPWKTDFSFSVCDPDDDLEGGDIRIYNTGTNTSFVGESSGMILRVLPIAAIPCDIPLSSILRIFQKIHIA
jgi:subtilisin family serine protease